MPRHIAKNVSLLDRRGFLGLAAGSLVALGAAACGISEEPTPRNIARAGKGDGILFDENGVCISGSTGNDALGPYWTPNLKQTSTLAGAEQPGQRLSITGHVFARDCKTPIPGVLMVAWQADDDGLYDYNRAGLNQGSSQRELSTSETNLRGLFSTDDAGAYTVETIFPKEYPLDLLDPANSAYRAPHVHFALFYTDRRQQRYQLVTQMYFAPSVLVLGKVPDLVALNAQDGGASTAEPTRFVRLSSDRMLGFGPDAGPSDGGSSDGGTGLVFSTIWRAEFDLVLDVSPSRI